MKRISEVMRVQPEGKEEYIRWHANPLPGINELIKDCNIRNYSIYNRDDYLFAYYEYTGDNYEADMAKMNNHPINRQWAKIVVPLMRHVDDDVDAIVWSPMAEIYHLD